MMGGVPLEDYLTSLDISAPILSAPAPLDTPPIRPPASFSRLPPELKAKIAAHVRELDAATTKEERRVYVEAGTEPEELLETLRNLSVKEGERSQVDLARMMVELLGLALPCKTGLAAFSLVNRDCYLAARPLFWKHVDLTKRTVPSLLTFVRDILPRHCTLVTSLKWDIQSNIDRDGLELELQEDEISEETRIVEEVERTVVEQLIDSARFEDLTPRRLRMPGLLVSKVVMTCGRLTAVDFAAFDAGTYNDELGHDWDGELEDDALLTLTVNSFHLSSISIRLDVAQAHEDLRQLCSDSPQLEVLKVSTLLYDVYLLESPGYEDLFFSFADLEHLVELSIGVPLPPSVDALDFRAPLRRLKLHDVSGESSFDFRPFVNKFSTTLTELVLDYGCLPPNVANVAASTSPPAPLPYHLPHLSHLTLATMNEGEAPHESVYSYFSESPISTLRISQFSTTTLPHIHAFLLAHRSTLKRVELIDVHDLGRVASINRKKLASWCTEVGVEYKEIDEELEEDDGEDEEGPRMYAQEIRPFDDPALWASDEEKDHEDEGDEEDEAEEDEEEVTEDGDE